MNLGNVVIEITRKCNLACEHCLRGDAENKNIKRETMEKFLLDNDIKSISNITFTGGEPTMNIKAMKDFLSICKEHEIDLGSFYIAINGTKVSDEFIMLMMEYYFYCSDNEVSAVQVSNSYYHTCQDNQDEKGIKKLLVLKFASLKEPLDYQYVINEGRGKELNEMNGVDGREVKSSNPEYIEVSEDYINVDDVIYLNVNGDICTACDFSYDRQDIEKIGNIHETKLLDIFQKVLA